MSEEKVMIVTNTQGTLVMSLKRQLEEQGILTEVIAAQVKTISQNKDEFEAVLLYCDENLVHDQQTLIYLRDCCVEDDEPLFLIGDRREIDQVNTIIPANTIKKAYVRPINVTEIASELSEFIAEYGRANKKKILVVDDSGAMLRNIKGWLEDKYQIILANSGAMAIKYLTLNRPDLVLLDYEMPVVDGKQVLEMIRTEMDFADVPVIFLTSKNDKESVANVVKLRPEGYLLKTMKPQEIVKSIDEFFEKQKFKQI